MENKLEFFTISDEEGNERHFMYVDTLDVDGKSYWICDEAYPDENGEEIILGDSVVFRVTKEGEDFVIESVEDEEEHNKVAEEWEKIEEEEFEDGDYEIIQVEDEEKK
ncbi:MAG: DUF1292 domain-containing protein [Thermotogota bacterium]